LGSSSGVDLGLWCAAEGLDFGGFEVVVADLEKKRLSVGFEPGQPPSM
jgi:hypothetical protein